MSWTDTALSTTASLAILEREINSLIQSSGTDYLSDGFDIAASGVSSSVDVKGGMIEVICKVATELTVKNTKELTIKMTDSADDVTFAEIYLGSILYTKTASGDETIAVDTELFRWVVPSNIEDHIKAAITSDATNLGTINIYTISKWEDKITVAKAKIKNKLETWLSMRGYKDYPDYDSDEVLIDLIANPDTFAIASDYLTLHYIFRDLAIAKGEDSIWYVKSKEYKRDFDEEFNEAVRRITLDLNQDGTAEDPAREDYTPKLKV